jgi:hypothetical protein
VIFYPVDAMNPQYNFLSAQLSQAQIGSIELLLIAGQRLIDCDHLLLYNP